MNLEKLNITQLNLIILCAGRFNEEDKANINLALGDKLKITRNNKERVCRVLEDIIKKHYDIILNNWYFEMSDEDCPAIKYSVSRMKEWKNIPRKLGLNFKKRKNPIKVSRKKECKIDKKCPEGYSRPELVEVANNCKVKIGRDKPKTGVKTKQELCDDILSVINSSDEEEDIRLRRLPDDIPPPPSPPLSPEASPPDQGIYDPSGMAMQVQPGKKRKCTNDKTIFLDDIGDIPTDKFIRTSSGFCHDIDELIQYIVSKNGINRDPSDPLLTAPVWKDELERIKIISHPGLDPEILEEYIDMLERNKELKEMQLRDLSKEPEILEQIGKTGFLCLNDKAFEHSKGKCEGPFECTHLKEQDCIKKSKCTWEAPSFDFGEKAILNLYDILNSLPNKEVWLQIKGDQNFTLGDVLKSINEGCIHGIGFKLSYLFAYWANLFKNKYGVEVKYPYFTYVPDSNYYITFHSNLEDIRLSKSNIEFTIIYINISDNIRYTAYGRFQFMLTKNKIANNSSYYEMMDFSGSKKIENFLRQNHQKLFDKFNKIIEDENREG